MEGKQYKNESSARKQILTALLATIPTFTYGIQIGWLSPMGPLLKSAQTPAQSPISDSAITWMAAALPLAAICGIPFFSYASDRFGRKICVIGVSSLSCRGTDTAPTHYCPLVASYDTLEQWGGAILLCVHTAQVVILNGFEETWFIIGLFFTFNQVSWIIKLAAITPSALITARVIAGLAAAGCFVVIPVYIKEISEDSWRGALTSLTMTVCKLGVIFVYVIGMCFSYKANQIVYLSIAGSHAFLFCFMPESPNFLLQIGSDKKAARTISWLKSLDRTHNEVTEELIKLKEERRKYEESPRVTLRSVVHDRPAFAALRLTLMLMAMQTLSGCFALMNYAADVFYRAGTSWSPNTLALFVGSLQLAGSFLTTVTIEKFGRKIPLASSSLVVSLCMITLATCFLVGSEGAKWLPVAAVCLCIFAYGVGLAPVPMVIMAEVFTFQFRTKMAGVSMAFSFFCSSMTVLFYTPVANQFGPYVVFYSFAAVTLFGVLYTILWVPETKGKSLEQIQSYWRKTEPVFV